MIDFQQPVCAVNAHNEKEHTMNYKELRGKTIGAAVSGGLDSCTITQWLTDNGVNVVAYIC